MTATFFTSAPAVPRAGRRTLVVVGNFDGVHRGHQALLAGARDRAAEDGLLPVVLTFDPTPAEVLGKNPPARLTTVPRKATLVHHVDPTFALVAHPFDRAFAAQSPRAFAEHLLAGTLGAKVVVVGRNFRFGAGRAGDFETLSQLGAELDFEVRAQALEGDATAPFSSTRVRQAIARGDVADAAAILGRPHGLEGVVVKGQERARSLGFPTANVDGAREAIPAHGVYAVRVFRLDEPGDDGALLGGGVANVGVRPTVAAGFAVEAHVFDFAGDLYGQRLRVDLVARLRDERKFAGLDELRAQIASDAEAARRALESGPNPGNVRRP